MAKQAISEDIELHEQRLTESAVELNRLAARIRALADKVSTIPQMDLHGLWALYDAFGHIGEAMGALTNAPRFEADNIEFSFNTAGKFLDEWKEAANFVQQAVFYQIKCATLSNEQEFNIYKEVLLNWEVRCGEDLPSLTATLAGLLRTQTNIKRAMPSGY